MGCFCGSSAALVNVVQDNVDKKVCRIINTGSLDSEATKVLSKSVPSVELAKVDVVDLERCNVLEGEQGHSSVERELLVPRYQASLVVWS